MHFHFLFGYGVHVSTDVENLFTRLSYLIILSILIVIGTFTFTFQTVSEDKTGCVGVVCLPYYLPLLLTGMIDGCLLLIVVPLVIAFYWLFGVADFITHKLQNALARIKLKDIQYKEFLLYTYLRYSIWQFIILLYSKSINKAQFSVMNKKIAGYWGLMHMLKSSSLKC